MVYYVNTPQPAYPLTYRTKSILVVLVTNFKFQLLIAAVRESSWHISFVFQGLVSCAHSGVYCLYGCFVSFCCGWFFGNYYIEMMCHLQTKCCFLLHSLKSVTSVSGLAEVERTRAQFRREEDDQAPCLSPSSLTAQYNTSCRFL